MNLTVAKRPLDLRDIKLGTVQEPVPIPDSYITDITGYPSYWQNGFGTCGAHSGAFLKVIQENIESGRFQDFSPRFLWDEIKQIDGLPIERGTDMRSIMKALRSKGICDYYLLPNDYTITVEQYTSPSNITPEMENNAKPRIIGSYAFIDWPSLNELKQAIYQNKAVLLTLRNFGNSFFGTETPVAGKGTYGHFVCCYGYDSKYIYIKDSCEKFFPYKKLDISWLPYYEELGTSVDLDDKVVQEMINKLALLQKLVALWQKILVLLKGR